MDANATIGFEDGKPVPVVGFNYDELEGETIGQALVRADQRNQANDVLASLIRFFLKDYPNAEHVGRRVYLIAQELHQLPYRNDRELAAALGISPGRLSQLKREFAS